jgi:CheY-like chemotaxis protein
MKIFILEDDPTRVNGFNEMFPDYDLTVTEFFSEAKELLTQNKYDVIFLDHDLGGRQMVSSDEEETGYQVAKIIDDTINKDVPVLVHSWNPEGAKNIANVLTNGKRQVVVIPFGYFDGSILKGS